jgi:hypothetical protein
MWLYNRMRDSVFFCYSETGAVQPAPTTMIQNWGLLEVEPIRRVAWIHAIVRNPHAFQIPFLCSSLLPLPLPLPFPFLSPLNSLVAALAPGLVCPTQ